jgi:hypothetical protein
MLPSLDAINLVIEEEIAQLPHRPYTALSILNKVSQFQTAVDWDVNVGGGVVNGRAATTNPSVQNTDNVIKATLPIGNYVADHTFAILITKLTELGNLPANHAPRALRELFRAHIKTAFDVIFPKLNSLIWTGTGAANTTQLQVYGMEYIVTAANTYAGIAPGTYADWVSYRNANAGTPRPLSKQLFSEVSVELFKRGMSHDVVITTPEIVELYAALFDQNPGKVGDNVEADVRYTGFALGGVPILRDKDCPSGTFWYLDSTMVDFYTFAQGVYGVASPDPVLSVVSKPENTMGINFLLSQLPNTNPQSVSYNLSVMPQLKVHDRRKGIAVLADIDQSLNYISGFEANTLKLPTPSPSPTP